MSASYPTSVWAPLPKVDKVNWVLAADVNALQDEVVALETSILTGPFKPAKINSPGAGGLLFRNAADNAELARFTNEGVLLVGTTDNDDLAAGGLRCGTIGGSAGDHGASLRSRSGSNVLSFDWDGVAGKVKVYVDNTLVWTQP